MRKIKTKIVLTLLPVLAVFLLYSCQSEFEEGYQPTQNITVKEFTFKQASKQQKFSTAMTKFDIGVKKSKSGRKVIDTDFVIDSATVKQVIASGQTTYTMAIKRANANQDFFENLIIQVKNGDSTRAYIAKYTSSQEMVFNEEHQSYGFQGAVETKEIDFDTTSYGILGDDYVLCVDAILCDQGGSTHIAGERCANTYCGTYCVTPQSGGGSSSNTGGGGSYSNTGNSTYGNYSNGSNGGSSGQTGIFTAPVVPTYTSVNLTTELLLNQEQQAWINNPAQFKIKKALQIYLFNNNSFDNNSIERLTIAKNLIQLNIELEQNPNRLLEVPCTQIPAWQAIAQHQVPQAIKDRIQNIDNQTGIFTSAGVQTLNDATNGSLVNMDFFPVTISQMPNKPNGQPYTKKELFDYIRTHINDFFDSLSFTPVDYPQYNINDTPLWQSNNPLGSILSINISLDPGSVVCSNFDVSTGEWIFSTITDPTINIGSHPVSGNRAFGYYTDVNGNMVIYTRGVDRLTFGALLINSTSIATSHLYANSVADAKWTNFQNKIKNFVNIGQQPNINGQSIVNIPVKYRPNWNKVNDVLKGIRPISDLGCN